MEVGVLELNRNPENYFAEVEQAAFNPANIVPGIAEAFEIISESFDRGYIGFITGPSRTADIERVLTIGVHGPSRFAIIAVDEEPKGGAA